MSGATAKERKAKLESPQKTDKEEGPANPKTPSMLSSVQPKLSPLGQATVSTKQTT
ncbi:hypothetical protein BDW71DRAFT_189951 [Aspergillus fruticulosus]